MIKQAGTFVFDTIFVRCYETNTWYFWKWIKAWQLLKHFQNLDFWTGLFTKEDKQNT